jgi:transposase
MFLTHSSMTGLRALTELTSPRTDAATAIFNLPDYRVLETEILGFGQRRIHIESTTESGCPACGVIGTRRHSRRRQRIRDIPVAGPVEVIWSKQRFFCDESECLRRTFFEATIEVPSLARSTRRSRRRAGIGRGLDRTWTTLRRWIQTRTRPPHHLAPAFSRHPRHCGRHSLWVRRGIGTRLMLLLAALVPSQTARSGSKLGIGVLRKTSSAGWATTMSRAYPSICSLTR